MIDLQRKKMRRLAESLLMVACLLAVLLPIGLLLLLLGYTVSEAVARLDWGFVTGYPSRVAGEAGILPALAGSLFLMGLTALLAVPAGVGAAIYLEEYGRRGRVSRWIESNIANLAGVPSAIYGLLGLGVFVRALGLGRSMLAAAATLAVLVLPVVILAAGASLRGVPGHLREACHALGATRWQGLRHVVLPLAWPGILAGSILAVSRALGEAAPLLIVGALTYVTFVPDGLDAPVTALPIQIFDWVSRPQREFMSNAAAGIVVLLGTMLVMNVLALMLRTWAQKRSV